MKLFKLITALFITLLIGCTTKNKTDIADKVFTNGNVITINEAQPSAEAVAIKDNKIIFVGSTKDAEAFIGEGTETTDLQGKTMMPGFVSAHDHLIASSWVSLGVQIYEAKDRAEAIAMIKEYADANPDKEGNTRNRLGYEHVGGLSNCKRFGCCSTRPTCIYS